MRKYLMINILIVLLFGIFVTSAMAENINKINITTESNSQDKIKYQWAEPIIQDLTTGKIKNLSSIGVKPFENVSESNITIPDYKPPYMLTDTDNNANPNMYTDVNQMSQYICFGGDDKPAYAGVVSFTTNDVLSLCSDSQEIIVAHVWGNYYDPQWSKTVGGECCVALLRSGANALTIGIKENQTLPFGDHYNQQETIQGIAGHTFNIGVRPNCNPGERTFTSVYYWVWDLTTNQTREYTLPVPYIETFKTTDYALECPDFEIVTDDVKSADNFISRDQYQNLIDLPSNYGYTNWQSDIYTLYHYLELDGTTGTIDLRYDPWFGYHYEKLHNIHGSQDGALTDYQVQFVIHKSTGIDTDRDIYLDHGPAGGSLSWPNDFRFTNANNETLSYWIESYNDTTAIVWVKIDYIAASPTITPIKVFYGKVGDPGASNGDATFIFFDHFNGSSVDWSKWNGVSRYNVNVNVANGLLTVSQSSGGGTRFDTLGQFGTNTAVRWKGYTSGPTTEFHWGFCNPVGSSSACDFYGKYRSSDIVGRNRVTSAVDTPTVSSIKNVYHAYDIKRRGSTAVDYSIDNGPVYRLTQQVPTINLPYGIDPWDYGGGQSCIVDFVFVYKTTAHEPGQSLLMQNNVIVSNNVPTIVNQANDRTPGGNKTRASSVDDLGL